MRKSFTVLSGIFLVSLTIWLITTCKKEEYVIVYSKVSTVRVYNTTSTSVSVEGSIDSLTSAAHDEFGFCLDTLSNPTVYKQKILASGTVQLGSFGGTITGLSPSKTYHIRAFIKDNKKSLYGQDISFTTLAATVPTVTTNSVTSILATTAVCGGNVTAEGDRPVTAKGVCFDTVSTPTVTKGKTMDGWGTGTYTSNLINLVPNKTYYVRAYAVSEFGIGYGSQKTFTTLKALYSFHEDYNDNKNTWDVGSFSGGSSSISGGEYSITYQESGYLYLMYNKFPDFISIASKDFEISTEIKISVYNPLNLASPVTLGGLIWGCDDTHFKYFAVNKVAASGGSYTYQYTLGEYSSSYTTWKSYTAFTAKDSTKLTIKKANSKYYFFVDDVQVYTKDYSTLSYDGVGFLVEDATVKADFIYIDQKDYKKSANVETVDLKSLPGGGSIIRSFPAK
jgi:hypothetical protein